MTTTVRFTETASVMARSNGKPSAEANPPPAPLPVDVKALSRPVLAALLAAAQRETELHEQEDRDSALEATSKAFCIPVARLKAALDRETAAQPRPKAPASGGTDRRSQVAPKYRNPANATETWSGRGAAPVWIELGTEISPKTGKPLPLPKFLIRENDSQAPGDGREP